MDFCAGRGSKQDQALVRKERCRERMTKLTGNGICGKAGWCRSSQGNHQAVECPCPVAEESRLPPVALNGGTLPQNLLGQDRLGEEHFVPVQSNCICDTADLCFVSPVLCGP